MSDHSVHARRGVLDSARAHAPLGGLTALRPPNRACQLRIAWRSGRVCCAVLATRCACDGLCAVVWKRSEPDLAADHKPGAAKMGGRTWRGREREQEQRGGGAAHTPQVTSLHGARGFTILSRGLRTGVRTHCLCMCWVGWGGTGMNPCGSAWAGVSRQLSTVVQRSRRRDS